MQTMEDYQCRYFAPAKSVCWDQLERVHLSDVVTGDIPILQTVVQACWNEKHIHFRFVCEDDHIVATMKKRDDPLFKEDVVEMFIDDTCSATDYMEIEISPRNVVFDARIQIDLQGRISVNKNWNMDGLVSNVIRGNGQLTYDILLPIHYFSKPPEEGRVWKVNLFRIDVGSNGVRNFSAWGTTGEINYHIPQAFKNMRFIRG